MNGPVQQTIGTSPRIETAHSTGILLVEDDVDSALVTRMVLELHGFHVRVAENSLDALAELVTFDPIAIVVDVGLGDGQGFELIKQIHRMSGDRVPVIALSGLRQANAFERCMSLGVADLISKPFSPSELLARVTACVHA